ncbi:hypothetical protein KCU78_g5027, partial [Aureobasidium melanogenum]
MSSGASTSGSISKEPPRKRLKQSNTDDYHYRPDMVLLGVEWPRNDNTIVVACVHSARFDQITKTNHRWIESAMGKDELLRVRRIDFDQPRCFVEFIAHYAQERNASAAVESAKTDTVDWIDRFLEIYAGIRKEHGFVEEIQDSLIDCLINWMRDKKHGGTLEEDILPSFIEMVNAVDFCAGSSLADSSHLIKLLAVLALYYARDFLEGHELHDGCEGFLQPSSRIRECAFAESLKAFPHGASTIPKDPLEEGFDEHCVYHIHGEDEPCYRSKLG